MSRGGGGGWRGGGAGGGGRSEGGGGGGRVEGGGGAPEEGGGVWRRNAPVRRSRTTERQATGRGFAGGVESVWRPVIV